MFRFRIDPELEVGLLAYEEAATLFALVDANREQLRRWLPWVDATKSAEDSAAFIQHAGAAFLTLRELHLGVRCEGELAGMISLHDLDWRRGRAALGYWLAHSHQGRGLVTRTTHHLLCAAFYELGLREVSIFCDVDNRPSRAVPERLGIPQVGTKPEASGGGELAIYVVQAHAWSRIVAAERLVSTR